MRLSILFWSTISGVILGLFLDATLVGVALLVGTVLPGLGGRLHQRWILASAIVVLALIPLTFAVLGYLEGELKSV